MTTEQWERENQDILMEYFIDGDPSVRRIQCEYCRTVIFTLVAVSFKLKVVDTSLDIQSKEKIGRAHV